LLKYFFENLRQIFKDKFKRGNQLQKEILDKAEALEKLLGFSFNDKLLFVKAITHRSILELKPELEKSNERLEFLGDSVLNMIVAAYLFNSYSSEGEGFLTKARSSLVNRDRLFSVAEKLNLKNYVLFNQRYLNNSVEGLQTILADCLEAVIGAIYLDQGLNSANKFVLNNIIYPYEEDGSYLIDTNYKGQLLEYTHLKKLDTPKYKVVSIDGPEHNREFTIEVFVGDDFLGIGKGRSKKIAEQNASRIAIQRLKEKIKFV
jgi:ribonuclease-3